VTTTAVASTPAKGFDWFKYLQPEYSYARHLGVGAAVYSRCTTGCELTLGKISATGNTVLNRDTGAAKPLELGAIFYSGQAPVLDAEAKQAGGLALMANEDQAFGPATTRSTGVVFLSTAEFAALDPELKKQPGVLIPLPAAYVKNEVENQPTSAGQPDTSCAKAAPIWSKVCASSGQVEIGQRLFDGQLVLVDSYQNVQVGDSMSFLKITLTEAADGPTGFASGFRAADAAPASGGGDASTPSAIRKQHIVTATKGILDVQDVRIYGPPGASGAHSMVVQVEISIWMKAELVMQTLKLESKPCALGSSISQAGVCETCNGPALYNFARTAVTEFKQLRPSECKPCNNTMFTCEGGSNLVPKVGYQNVQLTEGEATDIFIQCIKIADKDICLSAGKCLTGYQGVGCNTCSPSYYRDFNGKCEACIHSDGVSVVLMIARWLFFLIFAFYLTRLISSSLKEDEISVSNHLMKALINFFVLLALIL
jgi:hypothetical protein